MRRLQTFFIGVLLATVSISAKAAPQEAPPMEPPYTNDSEFDPLLGEDPSASSSSPIQTSPTIQAQPSASPTPALQQQASPRSTTPVQKSQSESHAQSPSQAPSSYTSDFPPSRTEPRKGVRMIPHPNAKKGLVRIEQNGTYVYKVKLKPTHYTGSLRFGQMEAPNIVSADGRTDFASMYETKKLPMVMFDYDWQPFTNFGKLGVEMGVGFAMATGNGRFLNGDKAQEVYTFVAIPLNLGVVYRFQYARNQWVAPYISGGGTYIGVAEIRDDNKHNVTGTAALYGAGGLMFNIGAMDDEVAFKLDNEYDVGGLWLTAEFRYQNALSEDLDFSGSIISLGISAEF